MKIKGLLSSLLHLWLHSLLYHQHSTICLHTSPVSHYIQYYNNTHVNIQPTSPVLHSLDMNIRVWVPVSNLSSMIFARETHTSFITTYASTDMWVHDLRVNVFVTLQNSICETIIISSRWKKTNIACATIYNSARIWVENLSYTESLWFHCFKRLTTWRNPSDLLWFPYFWLNYWQHLCLSWIYKPNTLSCITYHKALLWSTIFIPRDNHFCHRVVKSCLQWAWSLWLMTYLNIRAWYQLCLIHIWIGWHLNKDIFGHITWFACGKWCHVLSIKPYHVSLITWYNQVDDVFMSRPLHVTSCCFLPVFLTNKGCIFTNNIP